MDVTIDLASLKACPLRSLRLAGLGAFQAAGLGVESVASLIGIRTQIEEWPRWVGSSVLLRVAYIRK